MSNTELKLNGVTVLSENNGDITLDVKDFKLAGNTVFSQNGGIISLENTIIETDEIKVNGITLFKGSHGTSITTAVDSAQDLYDNNPLFKSGVYYVNTPDGGVRQTYCLNDGHRGWMLVGRLAADASSTITVAQDTVHDLIDISQEGTSYWSCDFGTYQATNFMVWASTDFTKDYIDLSTKVNFIYGINASTYPKFWMWLNNTTSDTNESSTATMTMGTVLNIAGGAKNGQTCDGAMDGPFTGHRWKNAQYTRHAISDSSSTDVGIKPAYFTGTPGTAAISLHNLLDAKFSVSSINVSSGQDSDGVTTSLIGYDDGNRAFFDYYETQTVNNNSSLLQFNCAATFWIC